MAVKRKNDNTEGKFIKLEEIVDKLENSDIDIDEALNFYKEGVELAIQLNERLGHISKEIYVLKEKLDGSFVLNNFEESERDGDLDE